MSSTKIFTWTIFSYTLQVFSHLNCKSKKIWISFNANIHIKVTPNLLHLIFKYLKNTLICQYTQLTDIVAVDNPSNILRFSLNYILLSMNFSQRLYINLQTNELNGIQSSENLFKSASFSEREVWDLFGIYFFNHTDLRRVLTDYGFRSHPLRKSFPLSGFAESFFDYSYRNIIYPRLIICHPK